jgi:DNA primase
MLQNTLLSLVPKEDKVVYTRMTDQALFYQEETALVHKLLALEEAEGLGGAAYSLRALQSSKQLAIATTGKDPITGRMRTEQYTVQGPVAVMLTTTSSSLDEETLSRFLTLTIDESTQMTETILTQQRQSDTLAGYKAALDRDHIIQKHHTTQRDLDTVVVLNPYAEQLTFPAHSIRARRDHKKYLMIMKVIAFMYQHQRTRHSADYNGEPFDYINVNKQDIKLANRLVRNVLQHSTEELSAPAKRLLKAIHEHVQQYSEETGTDPSEYIFTRKTIREAVGWSDWQIRTYSSELEKLEYLNSRSGAWGKEYRYALSWTPEQALEIELADPSSLKEPNKLAPVKTKQTKTNKPALAGTA